MKTPGKKTPRNTKKQAKTTKEQQSEAAFLFESGFESLPGGEKDVFHRSGRKQYRAEHITPAKKEERVVAFDMIENVGTSDSDQSLLDVQVQATVTKPKSQRA